MNLDLNHLGNKWLELKKQRMKNLLKIALPDEALYREIMLSLGFPQNKLNFLELALITPYYEIRKLKEKNIIEKALLYRAGCCQQFSVNFSKGFNLNGFSYYCFMLHSYISPPLCYQ